MTVRRVTSRLACGCVSVVAGVGVLWPAVAGAQEPATSVGGTVDSYLELALGVPGALATFPSRAGVSEATITATDAPVALSIADGDADGTARQGHLVAGSRVLPAPLEATVGGSPFQPLDVPLGPLLAQWTDVLASQRALIRLRQQASAAAVGAGPYAKTLLITVSTETP